MRRLGWLLAIGFALAITSAGCAPEEGAAPSTKLPVDALQNVRQVPDAQVPVAEAQPLTQDAEQMPSTCDIAPRPLWEGAEPRIVSGCPIVVGDPVFAAGGMSIEELMANSQCIPVVELQATPPGLFPGAIAPQPPKKTMVWDLRGYVSPPPINFAGFGIEQDPPNAERRKIRVCCTGQYVPKAVTVEIDVPGTTYGQLLTQCGIPTNSLPTDTQFWFMQISPPERPETSERVYGPAACFGAGIPSPPPDNIIDAVIDQAIAVSWPPSPWNVFHVGPPEEFDRVHEAMFPEFPILKETQPEYRADAAQVAAAVNNILKAVRAKDRDSIRALVAPSFDAEVDKLFETIPKAEIPTDWFDGKGSVTVGEDRALVVLRPADEEHELGGPPKWAIIEFQRTGDAWLVAKAQRAAANVYFERICEFFVGFRGHKFPPAFYSIAGTGPPFPPDLNAAPGPPAVAASLAIRFGDFFIVGPNAAYQKFDLGRIDTEYPKLIEKAGISKSELEHPGFRCVLCLLRESDSGIEAICCVPNFESRLRRKFDFPQNADLNLDIHGFLNEHEHPTLVDVSAILWHGVDGKKYDELLASLSRGICNTETKVTVDFPASPINLFSGVVPAANVDRAPEDKGTAATHARPDSADQTAVQAAVVECAKALVSGDRRLEKWPEIAKEFAAHAYKFDTVPNGLQGRHALEASNWVAVPVAENEMIAFPSIVPHIEEHDFPFNCIVFRVVRTNGTWRVHDVVTMKPREAIEKFCTLFASPKGNW